MSIITNIINIVCSSRIKQIEYFRRNPAEVQFNQFQNLIKHGANTIFGAERSMGSIDTIEKFQQSVDIVEYDAYSEYIERTKRGEQGVFWDSDVKFFAKSSGTTGAKSKYIPVTTEGLRDSHMRGGRDVVALFANNYPKSNVFRGKTLTLGGSRQIIQEGSGILTGDLSAILIENTPSWAQYRRVPSVDVALIADFERKIEAISKQTITEDVTSFAGVPSWNLVMMNKILEYTGKSSILDIWPNMELFVHGGMNFKPYKEQYHTIIPSERMKYMDTYNASEGFFAIADLPNSDDMLLMLDYNTFYEFLAMDSLGDRSKAVPLEGVKCGVNYAMIITSSNGLWRYMIGDTVMFTSTLPHRIKITGRTKHFINAFGEEVVVESAESAIHTACSATGASVSEFSVAPVYMEGRTKGAHEWVVEFKQEPESREMFMDLVDRALQGLNSDYEAKRVNNTTLLPPKLSVVNRGTFVRWMASRNKLGGQNKVPRLFNDRTYVDQLLEV